MKINRRSIVLMRLLMLVTLISLSACSGSGSEGGISGSGGPPKITVQGYAEKGPFLRRSEVTYRYINTSGTTLSEDFSTETTDDLGSFTLELEEPGIVGIRVRGYQFNEVTGQVSDGELTLRGLYLANDEAQQSAQVNLLTHIIYDRAIAITENGETNPSLAITQAEVELLNELETVMPDISFNDFSQISIYNRSNPQTQGNAYLLLFSAALYQHAINTTPSGSSVSGQMTLILNALADDFVDGDLEASSEILNGLVLAIQQLDPDQIISNLENRSRAVLGTALNVPDFSNFIGQFLITYPPENANLSAVTPVRLAVPSGMRNVSLDLIIDGVVAETISEPPYEFSWDPYFWTSAEEESTRHSILVRAYNSFGAEIVSNLINVNVLANSRNQIELTAPEPAAAIENSDAVTLQWSAYAGAAQYRVQVSNSSAFTSLLYNETTSGTSLDIDNLTAGNYFWRIQLTDENANTGTWSNTMQFSINGPLPPANISSSWEAGSSNFDVTISWENREYSSSVEYDIAHDANFNRRVATGNASGSSLLQNLEMGNYFIRMRSTNASGVSGDWSASTALSAGLFQTRLGGSRDDIAMQILASRNGGYIILASTNSTEVSSTVDAAGDDWIIKLNERGAVEWQYVSHARYQERFNDITETVDGSIIAVGQDRSSQRAVAIKLEADGNLAWETIYRPDSITTQYDYTSVTEFNGQLYVSAVEWEGCCTRERFYLNNINIDNGSTINSILAPSLDGVKVSGISKIKASSSGHLLIAGSVQPNNEIVYEHSGMSLMILNPDLTLHASWNNAGQYAWGSASNVIELSNGKFAVTGRSEMLRGDFGLSVVNADGTLHEYYEYTQVHNIFAGDNSNFYGLVKDNLTDSTAFVVFDSSLNYSIQSSLPDLLPNVPSGGMVRNQDGSFTLSINERENYSNDYDFIVNKRVF